MLTHGLHFVSVLIMFMTFKSQIFSYVIGVTTIILSSIAFAINVKYE